jgi:hypothetical protein
VWVDTYGTYYSLWPSDESMLVTANLTPGVPTSYSVITQPELTVRLSPAPQASGTVQLLTTESGVALDPTANANVGTVLGIPNDLAWGVRFKAMSLLLHAEGRRAMLCALRSAKTCTT